MDNKKPSIQFSLRSKEEKKAIVNYAAAQGMTVNSYLETVAIKLIESESVKPRKKKS